nr:molybdenum cofactor guanylyltransferase [uncultured Desulfobulbus sp.]
MIVQDSCPEEVWGCVLIGGKSRRMGTPKHLIMQDGQTWVERTVTLLQQMLPRVVIVGGGELPASLHTLTRVPDVPAIGGPLAGILAALRAFPRVSWLVVACDQPDMRAEAIAWLLACREPGVLAVMPDIAGTGRVEPLLAYYDRAILPLLETMAAQGHRRMNRLQSYPGVKTPTPPSHLHDSWHNINTPDALAQVTGCLSPLSHRQG